MGRIKGTNLSHVREFVVKELGGDALARLDAALPAASREAFASFSATGWYPEEVYVEVVRALDDAVGAGNGDMLRRGGAYAAEYDISRIHRLFFRIANPAFVLEKSTEIWARFFDTGEWTIKRQKATSAEGVLTGWTITDDRSCEYLRAYIQRMFEIVGAKDVENRHVECRARGGAQCRFLIAWR